jgi:putative transposase
MVTGWTCNMPSRNVIKIYLNGGYYHIYNRGVEKRDIFLDDQDYTVFLGLFKKYLAGEKAKINNGRVFESLNQEVTLLSYCLMPNHFHMLIRQETNDGIVRFMRRVATSYVMHFNKKYDRVGALFQGNYKASHVDADSYLHHISRYIHLNPKDYKHWPYSSYGYYLGNKKASWINPQPILDLFDNNNQQYASFVADYIDMKAELEFIKYQLADL